GNSKQTKLTLKKFKTANYPPEFIKRLRNTVSAEMPALRELCILNTYLGDYHAQLILETLRQWKLNPNKIDCVASHGQTMYHAPASKDKAIPNATLQMGDGDHIAYKTGILTISDFRQKHTAAG